MEIMGRNPERKMRMWALSRGLAATLGVATLLAGCQLSNASPGQSTPMATAQMTPIAATGSASSSELAGAASSPRAAAATPAAPAVNSAATQSAVAMQTAFEQVARTAEPAVVTITTLQRIPAPPRGGSGMPFFGIPRGGRGMPGGGGGGEDPFEQFFRQFQRDFGTEPGAYSPRGNNGGSAFDTDAPGFRKTQATGPLVETAGLMLCDPPKDDGSRK